MQTEELFHAIVSSLANYRSGDLLGLSDLADALAALRPSYQACQPGLALLDRIDAELKRVFAGAADGELVVHVGQALELLQQWREDLSAERKAGVESKLDSCLAAAGHAAAPSAPAAQPAAVASAPPPPAAAPAAPEAPGDVFQSRETLMVFVSEALERLDRAQDLILVLEANPGDQTTLSEIFRVFHTIKGESGFLKLTEIGELTHRLETIFDLLRQNHLRISKELADGLLVGVDLCRKFIMELKAGKPVAQLIGELHTFFGLVDAIIAKADPPIGAILASKGLLGTADIERVIEQQKSQPNKEPFGEIAVKEHLISPEDLARALEQKKAAQKAAPAKDERETDAAADEIIKVRLNKVNFLVDMIGELTIALGQVQTESLAMAQVRKITRSLQFGAMELRTDTMQNLFATARRIVRDLAHKLGKQVNLTVEGERLEVDRNLIKKLEEPLMHMVRNSMDHGIETPEERRAAGKPEQGTIAIVATRHGSTISVAVEDDGRGLHREAILAKAVKNGLVAADQAAGLSDDQVYEFIFASGFSTSQTVTQVSGRGVGMDIVRTMVRASRGSIGLANRPGNGATFTMTFPISTAIIDGLIVRVGDNQLVVPVSSVVESLKVPLAGFSRVNGNAELLKLRDQVFPVIRLGENLGIVDKGRQDRPAAEAGGPPAAAAGAAAPAAAGPKGHAMGLIVRNSGGNNYFLGVDEVVAKREVVLKPLGSRFKGMRGITAGTVMAGGAIGLVLDVDEVVNLELAKQGMAV